jgi:hypothetical protein
MNTIQGTFNADGAIIDLLVGLAAGNVNQLRSAGSPVPQPIPVRALLDTGAEMTCADPTVLAPLIRAANLHPTRTLYSNVPAAGGLNIVSVYTVGITIVHPVNPRANLVLRTHPVLEQPLGPLPYQALLGRDVLAR